MQRVLLFLAKPLNYPIQKENSSLKESRPNGKRLHFFSVLGLVSCCLLVYWPVILHEFQMEWDDQWQVINHYTEQGFAWSNLWNVLTEFFNGQYSPVNQFYYIILYALFDYNPLWFHLGSIVFHMANVLLVYVFINKLLEQTKKIEAASLQRIAFITALLMAIHPLMVEAVAWISASKIVLYALFYLIGLNFYLEYLRTSRPWYLFITLFSFILSFGSKEQAVTFPVCLLLIDSALGRNLISRKVWLEKIPFLALSIFFGIITILLNADSGAGFLIDNPTYPFYQHLLFGSYSLWEYVTKIIIPVKLSYLYLFPNQVGEAVPLHFWFYPLIIVFLCITLWRFWKKPWVFFSVSFFVIHLILVLHIIPMPRFVIIADRYVYLASIGLFFSIACLFDQALAIRGKYNRLLVIFSIGYTFALGAYAHERGKVWHDSETLKDELLDLVQQQDGIERL